MVKQSTVKPKDARALIVIPTLGDRPDLLRQTLESIVNQKTKIVDTVVVCPGGSPARKIAKEFGITVATDTGGGISSALNVGFRSAKPNHKYGGWMGDDDLLRPDSITATVGALDSDPNAVLAFGYCDYIDDRGHVIFKSRVGTLAPWIMRWGPNLLPLPGLLYRLSAAKKVGEYDESLKYTMDLDMWLRLRKHGRFINTHKTLGAFRWHATSTTVTNRKPSLTEAEIVKRRYLPKPLQFIAPLWEAPVRLATYVAARRVNSAALD
jgi:glycosyltransferase involved in cell wall biosynthesis